MGIMADISRFLHQDGILFPLWATVIWAFSGFLILLGLAIFLQPQAARRFLMGYARTVRINSLEAGLRFLAGIAFMGIAPVLAFSRLFFIFGAILAVTAVFMALLPGLHRRWGVWAKAFTLRILPVYGGVSLLLGIFIVYGLTAG